MSGLRWLALLVASTRLACIAAPVEIEVAVEIGKEKVDYRAHLRDVRTVGGGLVNSLPIFARVATPPEEALLELPWLDRPGTYRWEAREGAQTGAGQ